MEPDKPISLNEIDEIIGVATLWSAILGKPVTPAEVVICQAATALLAVTKVENPDYDKILEAITLRVNQAKQLQG